MIIKRFNKINGFYPEPISGQTRFAFSKNNFEDFYDIKEYLNYKDYRGQKLYFYDYDTANVYSPFEKTINIVYGVPIYFEGFFYFLQGDFNKNKISLYKYLPEKILENVVEFDIKDVNLYNLKLIGNGVNIISGDDEFVCYYPSKFKFKLPSNEQVILIDEEKVYINAWIEEDFDEENNCAGDNYKYYEKLVIRDFWDRFISEEIGNLNKAEDGNWWIS